MSDAVATPSADAAKASRWRLAYLLRYYPRFSETFIVNEILSFESHGADLRIVAMRKPDDGVFHEAVSRVRTVAEYFPDEGTKLREKARRRFRKVMRQSPRKLWAAVRCVWRHRGLTWVDLRYALYLLHWAKRSEVRHVHVHFGREPAGVAMLASMIGKLTYSMTLHAYDIFRDDVDAALLAKKIEHAALVVTVSEFNRRYLLERFPAARDKVVVHYNGIDLMRFAPPRPEAQRERGLIFSVGRLIEKKGFTHLIAAVALLRDRGVVVRCVIAGDGEDAEALRQQIDRLQLRDVVVLAGLMKQDEVRAMMQRAACFVLPCVQAKDGNMDALPTVLLESLGCGCPTVSTKVSGVPEIIDDGVHGLLAPPGDVASLADAIERVLRDDALATQLAAAGRRRAEERFDSSRNGAVLLQILQGLAGRRKPAANRAPADASASTDLARSSA